MGLECYFLPLGECGICYCCVDGIVLDIQASVGKISVDARVLHRPTLRHGPHVREGRKILTKHRFTLGEIRQSLGEKREIDKQEYLLFDSVFRPLSFYLTWLFLRLGISANQVTYISLLVGLTGLGLLAFGGYGARVLGALLLNFWIVLDCVDGNIARCTSSSSRFGFFLDTTTGHIINLFLFLSVGIGMFINPDCAQSSIRATLPFHLDSQLIPVLVLILGCWASEASTFARLIYQKCVAESLVEPSGEFTSGLHPRARRSGWRWIAIVVSNRCDFIFPFLLVCAILDIPSIFILFYALINTAIMGFSVWRAGSYIARSRER